MTWFILLASSGATASLLYDVPPSWWLIRPVLAVTSAGLSLWLLVSNYTRNATEFSALYIRWNRLALDYEALWANMYIPDAQDRLAELRQRAADISERTPSLPFDRKLIVESQQYTLRHIQQTAA
jgi:hypothetical protein